MHKNTLAALLLLIPLTSCYTLQHDVGQGAQGTTEVTKRQWYVLWGLVPIGDKVDGTQLAEGASDYTVQSSITPIDFLMNIVTGLVTIHSQTVTTTH